MNQFHYAIQICDTSSRDPNTKRFCGEDRTLLTKKSITSFLNSINYLIQKQPQTEHTVMMLADNCSDVAIEFLNKVKKKYERREIKIQIQRTQLGCRDSMRVCYDWLGVNGKDFVYLVQDDYIFLESALYEMASIFFQINNECGNTHPIVISYNYPKLWNDTYKNLQTPRTIFVGENRYWIQSYDTPCTFLTSMYQLSNNWDLIQYFLQLPFDFKLESKSLNKMFTKKGILGILPINSVALHMQSYIELDPYIDWKSWWNKIDIEESETKFNLPVNEKILLNIGGGGLSYKNSPATEDLENYRELFVDLNQNSNPDICTNMIDLHMIPSDSIDCVYSSHALEHIHFHEISRCISEWYRVIKNDGHIRIIVPNLKVPAQMAAEGRIMDKVYDSSIGPILALDMFYGHRDEVGRSEYMAHKTGFTKESIELILNSLNYKNFEVIEDNFHNLVIKIYK
jgi:hypothetical protein